GVYRKEYSMAKRAKKIPHQPPLVLVVRDGQRLRPCGVREYTPTDPRSPIPPWQAWPVCGQMPTMLDPEGTPLCAKHFHRLATCGVCGAIGVQGTTLTWDSMADCMLCAGCMPDEEV